MLVTSRLPGLWKNDVTPYLVGIMDVMALPFVWDVCICKAPQTGVSEATMNFIGFRILEVPLEYYRYEELLIPVDQTENERPLTKNSHKIISCRRASRRRGKI